MNGHAARSGYRSRAAHRACGTALLLLMAAGAFAPVPAIAQSVSELGSAAQVPADSQMLLEADELIYDRDGQTVWVMPQDLGF